MWHDRQLTVVSSSSGLPCESASGSGGQGGAAFLERRIARPGEVDERVARAEHHAEDAVADPARAAMAGDAVESHLARVHVEAGQVGGRAAVLRLPRAVEVRLLRRAMARDTEFVALFEDEAGVRAEPASQECNRRQRNEQKTKKAARARLHQGSLGVPCGLGARILPPTPPFLPSHPPP